MKKVKLDDDYVIKANNKRMEEEKAVIFPTMFKQLNSLRLKRIDLSKNDFNNHEHKDVIKGRYYLVGARGYWVIAKSDRNYWDKGWTFSTDMMDNELGHIDFLFEISNLENYEKAPLGRLERVNSYEDDED